MFGARGGLPQRRHRRHGRAWPQPNLKRPRGRPLIPVAKVIATIAKIIQSTGIAIHRDDAM